MVCNDDCKRSHLTYIIALLFLCLASGRGEVRSDAAEIPLAVASLLKSQCVKCHGPIKPKGGLDLSSPSGLAHGGESGTAVVGGELDQSLLWQRVDAGEMPPDGPLGDDEKRVLRLWISDGADGLDKSGAGHWAFLPLVKPAIPVVRDGARVRNSLDRLVQSRLERKNTSLGLGPDADPQTLIRRVSLDVTGLPPTPAEVTEFVNDVASNAYEQMVDRYLASPNFGQRWGKHWLDAAGYADSNGYFSADTDRPLAYRYRDYVIESFNVNKPFDRFLIEQLAGDELAQFRPGTATSPESIELLIATHFLRNGQDGTDIGVQEPEAFEIDRRAALEAAVQVTVSSLLGLTTHCARCHDHKFEPITQREYYGLQSVFFPAFNPQDWVNPKDRIAYAFLPGEKESWERNEDRIRTDLARLRTELNDWLTTHREPSELLFAEGFDNDEWLTRWSNTAPGDDKPGGTISLLQENSPTGTSPNEAQASNGMLRVSAGLPEAWLSTKKSIDWTPETTGDWVQATFDLIDNKIGGTPAERIGYTIAAHDYDDSGITAGGNILVDGNPTTTTQLYLDYPGSDSKPNGQIGLQGYVPGRNYGVRVTNLGNDKFRLEHLVDGLQEGTHYEVKSSDLSDGGFAFYYCCNRSYVVDNVRIERSLATTNTTVDVLAQRKELEARRKSYDEQRKKLEEQRTKEPGLAIAWVTDKSTTPPIVPLLTRGLYHLREASVEPGGLALLTDKGQEYQPHNMPSDSTTTGRRLGFADWLLREGGRPAALVARVHVNRIWREYFGRGIVATTDNLGQSGSPPTHPELLNELATSFIQSGWDQKSLHRHILLSSTYRQSSARRNDGIEADPENRLYWRFPVRRLQAEMIRDGMLFISGQLDSTPRGPYVVTQQTAVGEVIVDPQIAGAHRRSVYLQQRRSQTLSMLKVFDAPAIATICTTRPSSTVPLQSLSLLNSDFAVASAEAFARRLLRETDGTDAELIQRAWLLAVARAPTANEELVSSQFLKDQRAQYMAPKATEWGLADFCQMLLASNSFLYLE